MEEPPPKAEQNFWLWGKWGRRHIKCPFLTAKLSGVCSKVVVGQTFIASLQNDGTLWTWGQDQFGCLGLGEDRITSPDPRKIALPEDAGEVTDLQGNCGNGNSPCHLFVLTSLGKLFVWGCNSHGQLGLGDRQNRYEPTLLALPAPVIQALPLKQACCALLETGTVYFWGGQNDFPLAPGSKEPVCEPARVGAFGERRVKKLDMCCQTSGDTVVCAFVNEPAGGQAPWGNFWLWGRWGKNDFTAPIFVERIVGEVRKVALVASGSVLTLLADGSLRSLKYACADADDCMGLGPDVESYSVTGTVQLAEQVADISAGARHVIAITADGKIYSWGCNEKGQLGIGDLECKRRFEPALLSHPPARFVQAVATADASYAVTDLGFVYAWGCNKEGVLALEHDQPRVARPQAMIGMAGLEPAAVPPVRSIRLVNDGLLFLAFVEPADDKRAEEREATWRSVRAVAMEEAAERKRVQEEDEAAMRAKEGWTPAEEQEYQRLRAEALALLHPTDPDDEAAPRNAAERAAREYHSQVMKRIHKNGANCKCVVM